MTPGISIRLRLTLWYSAVLLLGLLAFGFVMAAALEHRLLAGVDISLSRRVEGLKTTLEVESRQPGVDLSQEVSEFARETAEGDLMDVRDGRGSPLLPVSRVQFPEARPGFFTIARNGHTYRVLASPIEAAGHQYQAVIASDLQPVHAVISDFRRVLLLTIPLVLCLAGAGGYWISTRALAPVDEITRVATSISVQNLSRRLAVPQTRDEISRMSQAWNGVLERLEGAVKRIQQFTADASHELRTPVALIRATAELALRRERTPEEYRKSLEQIHSETARMTQLTDSLLMLARADAGGSAMPLEPADLKQVIDSVVEQAGGVASEKSISLHSGTNGDRLVAPVNQPALRRLLLILVDNAVKYTPAGGSVTVSAAHTPAGIQLAVEDTGEGIAEEALPHVFERFYRADPARSGSGAGLGLAIAQAIAHAHHASITVDSAPGRHTRFALTLPLG